MALALDRWGVPFLNIHELFLCSENRDRVLAAGARAREGGQPAHLSWRPTARGLEPCLELLLFAARRLKTLSVFLCSCGTQEEIARRGLRRRRAEPGAARRMLLH
jgi:pyruvate formate-lyase activating enzyme-like uncharacterized protein